MPTCTCCPAAWPTKVRAFFAAHMATEHRDHVQPFAYPIDHAAVLTSMAADGVDRVWSFSYAHKPGVAAGLNEAAATTAATFASGPVELAADDIARRSDRFLFGSDAPNTPFTVGESLARVRALGLPPDVEAAVLGGNAVRLSARVQAG